MFPAAAPCQANASSELNAIFDSLACGVYRLLRMLYFFNIADEWVHAALRGIEQGEGK